MSVSFIKWFFTVHKCGGCGEILDREHHDAPFCDACMLAWRASLTASCTECFLPALECRCMPKQLESAGALCLRKLFFYESENAYTPQMGLIYWLKRRKSRRMTAFAADNIVTLIRGELEGLGLCERPEKFVMSFVPRGKRAVIEYGFDHASLVARAIAKRLGIAYAPLLRSSFSARTQKELGKRQRLENARRSIALAPNTDVEGRYVILFDDIVTSGASMSVCVKALMKAGAAGVLCFSLASKK